MALAEGNHKVVVEYEEDAGLAYVHFSSQCACRRCYWERPKVVTHTRAGDNSGTKCNILATLFGESGYTDELLLRSGMDDGKSQTSNFEGCDIECARRIGTVTKIQLRTDCGDGWKFDGVDVFMPDFRRYHFGPISPGRVCH
jgi:hypothetical protein